MPITVYVFIYIHYIRHVFGVNNKIYETLLILGPDENCIIQHKKKWEKEELFKSFSKWNIYKEKSISFERIFVEQFFIFVEKTHDFS